MFATTKERLSSEALEQVRGGTVPEGGKHESESGHPESAEAAPSAEHEAGAPRYDRRVRLKPVK